jgi:hypothetical protein
VYLKAMLVCDDVRIELGGTMTLVGVHNDRLIAPPGDGPIRLARLMFVAIVGGLSGVESVGFRQRIRETSELVLPTGQPMTYEAHDAKADEHNFVFGDEPMLFPGPGSYEVALDIEAGQRATYILRFTVERRT